MRPISSADAALQKVQQVWLALTVYLRGGRELSVTPVLAAELAAATP